MEHDGDALLIRHFLTGDNIPITIGILAQVVAHLQVIILFHSLRTVHLIGLVVACGNAVRGEGKLFLAAVEAAGEGRGSLCGIHDAAVRAVRHTAGLDAAVGEVGGGRHGVVGDARVGELVHRLGHFDDGERHAVGHGEGEQDLAIGFVSIATGGHEVGGGVACGVVALVGSRLPVIDERGEEVGIVRDFYLARHVRLVGIVEEILLASESSGESNARFGLPCQVAVRACGGCELYIFIYYRFAAHDVESALVAGRELGAVAILRGAGKGFLHSAVGSRRSIAAVGDGDGERCGIVSTGQGKLLLRAAGQQQCRRPKGM